MSTFMQMTPDFDGMGFHFNGHVEYADIVRLNLTPFEKGILEDALAPNSSAYMKLYALMLIWQRREEDDAARERYPATGVPILPVDGK